GPSTTSATTKITTSSKKSSPNIAGQQLQGGIREAPLRAKRRLCSMRIRRVRRSGCAVAAALLSGLRVGKFRVGTDRLLDLLGDILALFLALVRRLLETLDRAADITAERAEFFRPENQDDHGQDDQPVPDAK